MAEHIKERRSSRRIDAHLKLELMAPGAEAPDRSAKLETINISTSGVYFRSGHYIEPMTKVAMELEVGVPAAGGGSGREVAPVACEGLVVRVSPEAEVDGCTKYEVAVFFTNISPEGVANLERHIALLMDDD